MPIAGTRDYQGWLCLVYGQWLQICLVQFGIDGCEVLIEDGFPARKGSLA